jgi:hypothetical protein
MNTPTVLKHPKLSPAGELLKQNFMKMGLEWCAEEILFLRRKLKKLEKRPQNQKGLVSSAEIDAALSREDNYAGK